MRIAIAGDHAGFTLKKNVEPWIISLGHEVKHLGAFSMDPNDDYPDFALLVAKEISSGKADKGIIICGSGVGACITANKVKGVRAAICHDIYSSHQGVEHDDMNVLCLGSRVINQDLAKKIIESFLNSKFSYDDRHVRRLQKVMDIEGQN
jgi:ribose 5-phosphate isomerase B